MTEILNITSFWALNPLNIWMIHQNWLSISLFHNDKLMFSVIFQFESLGPRLEEAFQFTAFALLALQVCFSY